MPGWPKSAASIAQMWLSLTTNRPHDGPSSGRKREGGQPAAFSFTSHTLHAVRMRAGSCAPSGHAALPGVVAKRDRGALPEAILIRGRTQLVPRRKLDPELRHLRHAARFNPRK